MEDYLHEKSFRPRHRWSLIQRKTLCVLDKWYANHHSQITTVFNKRHGLNLKSKVVVAQITDMRRKRDTISEECRDILFKADFSHPPPKIRQLRKQMLIIAKEIGVSLKPRLEEKHSSPSSKTHKRHISELHNSDDEEDHYSIHTDDEHVGRGRSSEPSPCAQRAARLESRRTQAQSVTSYVQRQRGK